MDDYFIYKSDNIYFTAKEKDFITFIGNKNKEIIDNIIFKNKNDYITLNYLKINKNNLNKLINKVGFATIDFFNIFVSETLQDELAFNLESKAIKKSEMIKRINDIYEKFKFESLLNYSPLLLNRSEKVKLSIARCLITKPKMLIIDNLLNLLDKNDYELVCNILKEYVKDGNIILNFTTNIEESLLGNIIIVTDNEKIAIKGSTLSVLNEERIMKRLGIGLPFIILLNKYLKDYNLLDNYVLSYKGVSDLLWK